MYLQNSPRMPFFFLFIKRLIYIVNYRLVLYVFSEMSIGDGFLCFSTL